MNFSSADARRLSQVASIADGALEPSLGFWTRRRISAREAAFERKQIRQARDVERGYRINIKQVVLAFIIEFFIIGIGLAGWWFFSGVAQAMLYPAALALVELARVPLAIAVRVQRSWNIQFAALIGVAAAVVVTSTTLYQIGELTFSPRRANVYIKSGELDNAKREQQARVEQKAEAQSTLDQINKEYENLSKSYNDTSSKPPLSDSKNCTTIETSADDGTGKKSKTTCARDPAYIAWTKSVADLKKSRDDLAVRRGQWQEYVSKLDLTSTNKMVSIAETEYRNAIQESPLHSYAAMLFGKDQRDLTEGEVKKLEWYLLLIPSIAAALSSTLIAMTAVHRIKPPDDTVVQMPDEAVKFLLGPLLNSIREEARATVSAALNGQARTTAPPVNSSTPEKNAKAMVEA